MKVSNKESMTLELKYVVPYLPYDLDIMVKCDGEEYRTKFVGIKDFNGLKHLVCNNGLDGLYPLKQSNDEFTKPILRPLSDLTKEIEHNGERFVPSVKIGIHVSRNHVKEMPKEFSLEIQGDVKYRIKGFYNYTYLKYSETQKLLEWHFDLFGLIENGLAVDINTLPKKSTDD